MVNDENRMSQRDFVVIRDLLKERCGIFIRDSRSDYLEYRVRDRMAAAGVKSYGDYYYYLKYSPDNSGELQELINLITVQETSFFRNSDQLNSFRDTALKELLERKKKAGSKDIRIWSVPCSTGEEPLTIAIIVSEFVQYLFNWNIEILATDISTRALKLAKQARYDEQSMRHVPEALRTKYFIKNNELFSPAEALTRLITYRQQNLTNVFKNGTFSRDKSFDVIFCRNLFIYFPDDVKEHVSAGLYSILNPGGYLFMGNAEGVDIRKVPFRMTFLPGGMVYQKPHGA